MTDAAVENGVSKPAPTLMSLSVAAKPASPTPSNATAETATGSAEEDTAEETNSSTRSRRRSVKAVKYVEDGEVSDGEAEIVAEKKKKARQLDYQSADSQEYPLLDQIVGRRINKKSGAAEYLCKFVGRSYLHLWWLTYDEVEMFIPEGYQKHNRVQLFDRRLKRDGYSDLDDADDLEINKVTVEKIINHKIDPLDKFHEQVEKRRKEVPFVTKYPRVTDHFLVDHAEELAERLAGVVKKLLNENGGDVFAQPVDTTDLPDYLNVILNPMDLGTIASRISRENYYTGPAAVPMFAADVRLVFINCKTFNEKGSDIWQLADDMLQCFEKWFYDWILCPSAWLELRPAGHDVHANLELIEQFRDEAEASYDLWAPWQTGCSICRSNTDSEKLLLCDRCDGEIHMFCSTPEIKKLPDGEWFCSFCQVRNKYEEIVDESLSKLSQKQKADEEKAIVNEDKPTDAGKKGKGNAPAKDEKTQKLAPYSPRMGDAHTSIPKVLCEPHEYEKKVNRKVPKKTATSQSGSKGKTESAIATQDRATYFLVKWVGMSIRFSTWERPEDIGDDEQIQRYFKFSRVPTQQEIQETTCQLPCCAQRNQMLWQNSFAQKCCEKDRFCTLGWKHSGECSREIKSLDKAYGTDEFRRLRMIEQIKAQLFAFHCLLNNHAPDKEVLKQCGAHTNAYVCKRQYLQSTVKPQHDEVDDEDYSEDEDASESDSDEPLDDDELDELRSGFRPPVMYPAIVEPDNESVEGADNESGSTHKKPEDEVSEVLGFMVEHVVMGYPAEKPEKVVRRAHYNCFFPPTSFQGLKSFTEFCVPIRRSVYGLGMRLGLADNGSASVLGFQELPNGMMGPAEASGVISVGDVLVGVNKFPVAQMNFKDIINFIGRSPDFLLFHFHSQKPAFLYPPICQARPVVIQQEEVSEDAADASDYIVYSYNDFKPTLRVGTHHAAALLANLSDQFIVPNGPMQHLYAAICDNSIDPHEHFASFLPEKRRTKRAKPGTELSKDDPDEKASSKSDFIPYEQSPTYKGGRTLRAYQVEGLNWMISCWKAQRSCILADEMGLGKTVQIVSVIEHLRTEEGIRGPYLIVVPLSTIQHWRREIESWTDLNVCVYHDIGDRYSKFTAKDMRAIIREQEWYYPGLGNTIFKFNILLTTFETLLSDFEEVEHIHWRLIVVDEAHRLKSSGSRVLKQMRVLHCDRKILLTGTPLQNNTQELWVLLNYLEPVKFDSLEEFNSSFGKLQSQEQVIELQKLLAPYLLRRVKEDVEKSIPPKEETIISVELTTLQKQYYRAIYDKNKSFLYRGTRNGLPTLNNIQLQLRKCCNHPFLIKGVEDRELEELGENPDAAAVLDKTIASSGKFVLVSKLLPKLKREGHKVLIFSQFLKQLDLLERYCEFNGFGYERLDGTTSGSVRQSAIDRFSRPNSKTFIFLLSTKAGGVGINLIAADTVIIFDSDWNPQNDLQAQSRCHRIGQKKSVQIYRLVTRNTYESEMFDRASKKLGLEHAVLGTASFNETSQSIDKQPTAEQLVELLKRGAYALMDDDDSASKQFAERDIETILKENARVRVVNQVNQNKDESDETNPEEEEDVDSDETDKKKKKRSSKTTADRIRKRKSLGGMAVDRSSFVAEGSSGEISVDDPNFWEKVLPGQISVEMLSLKLEDGSALSSRQAKNKFINNLDVALNKLVVSMREGAVDEDDLGFGLNLEHEYDLAIQVLHRMSTKLRREFSAEQLDLVRGYLNKLEKSRIRSCRLVKETPVEPHIVASKKRKRRLPRNGTASAANSAESDTSGFSSESDEELRKMKRNSKKKRIVAASAGRASHSRKGNAKKRKAEPMETSEGDLPSAKFTGGVIHDSDDLCTLCGDGGLILLCDGPCHRSFHLECVGMESEPTDERWLCPDCAAGKHRCLICKNVGEMGTEFGVLQCSAAKCGRFYHKSCLADHPKVEWVGKKRFRCPSHFCHGCDDRSNEKRRIAGTKQLISCIHCSESYHVKCIGNDQKIIRLSKSLMICANHLADRDGIVAKQQARANAKKKTEESAKPDEPVNEKVEETSTTNKEEEEPIEIPEDISPQKRKRTGVPEVKVCALCHGGEMSTESNGGDKSANVEGQFMDAPVRLQFSDRTVEYAFVHLNCALHSAEVYVKANGSFCNLTRAIKRGRQLRCVKCKQFGATVGCVVEKCRCNYHLRCAIESGGEFLDSAYSLYCKSHAAEKKKQPKTQCVCGTQVTDDQTLILKCFTCSNRFHPRCVNMSERQAMKKAKEQWWCQKCADVENSTKAFDQAQQIEPEAPEDVEEPSQIQRKSTRSVKQRKNPPRGASPRSAPPRAAAASSRSASKKATTAKKPAAKKARKLTGISPHEAAGDLSDESFSAE